MFAPASVSDNEPGSDQSSGEEDDEWDPVSKRPQTPHRQQKQDQVPQTTTHTYTLLRFSTCQILEENCNVTWYDIQPHELDGLHSSFLPPTFTSSLPSPHPNIIPLTQTKFSKKKASSTDLDDQGDLPLLCLTALPRHTPTSYIQCYWQGWVCALSVVSRIQTTDDPSLEDNDTEGNGEKELSGARYSRWCY